MRLTASFMLSLSRRIGRRKGNNSSTCGVSPTSSHLSKRPLPRAISFEEASKISPQVRLILKSFPEVTTVANELGRPDDGTNPTGFFNNEFYVGLKPYSQWKGKYRTKTQLIDAIDKRLQSFPGIIFNYTQPAEDAVDEAETGLKSSLAVKIFGPDLATLESTASSAGWV